MGVTQTVGIDFTLPEPPPLRQPPLSLLDLAPILIDDDEVASANEQAQQRIASYQERTAAARQRIMDQMANADAGDRRVAIAEAVRELEEAIGGLGLAEAMGREASLRYSAAEKWEQGFQYLPELSNGSALSVFVDGTASPGESSANTFAGTDPTTTNIKPVGPNQAPWSAPSFAWYNPFHAVALDSRSTFGWPITDLPARQQRALRALLAHEAWQVEQEYWTGKAIPTNLHLGASTNTPTTSPRRTLSASTFAAPTAAPGTTLGTAATLSQSLSALDQAIAELDAGTGMIHATPYVVQEWMKLFPYIRDSNGRVFTVNMNLIVPGYGYTGSGPDEASRTSGGDGHTTTGSTTITSATAAFTGLDVGAPISGSLAGIPAGTYIVAVTNATTAVISQAATANQTLSVFTIGGAVSAGRCGGQPQEWAYATDTQYLLRGGTHVYPWDESEAGPYINQQNLLEVRAERPWAVISNQLLRAAVLVDTTQS